MLRSQRLAVVLELEQRREQQALEKLAAARDQWQQHQNQLEELRQYQAGYQQQIRNDQQGTVSVARLQGWQAFVTQLDQVIGQQEIKVQKAKEQMEQCRQDWQQAYERRRGMARFIDSCREQEQRAQDARDQKAMDEAAGRAFGRRR
ncbi:flagellar export protein FliJ [Marinobacter sp. CA1]|uniref:flagellar export protein FliJ n=1 Tax=Marinobacter sp. CA1 TaxID=2817656 RepID=UPI001D07F96B|nr:flagellar export protein FliJ [Marinobacter sp. CA1]MCG8516757.1 flagellar export protein FliJ [Pseudomonadales bacterium]UDL06673.1 flagellar export protein FliJ [Marinobacter sp. CA1]